MRLVSTAVYIAVFFVTAFVVGPACYFGTSEWDFAGCGPAPQGNAAFLAGCTQPNFGDFDHAAYLWDLEPAAVRSLMAADVVFLGNSRTQFGFSTRAVSEYFRRAGIPYYLLGFGNDEKSGFIEQLARKYHFKPKVYIINADPFFSDDLSPPMKELQSRRISVWLTYALKWIFVREQRSICSIAWLCTKSFGAVYRVSKDGSWIWQDYLIAGTISLPLIAKKDISLTQGQLSRAKVLAREFIARSNIPPECIILTGVPTNVIDSEAVAIDIGHAVGLQVILPVVENLSTVDQSHLNVDSAERWSAAFIDEVAPVLDRCLAQQHDVPAPPPS